MATRQTTMDYIVEQTELAGDVVAKKMFGEYALYCDVKFVALVCDDQLFVKPTIAGRAFIGDVVEAPPYKGAKPYFLIEDCDDREWLSSLIKISAEELPLPKKKVPSKVKKKVASKPKTKTSVKVKPKK